MIGSDEADGWLEDEGPGSGGGPPPPGSFDPLLSPWTDVAAGGALSNPPHPAPAAGPHPGWDDPLGWEVAATAFPFPEAGPEGSMRVGVETWRPPPFETALTDAQRRLRTGTITIPRPERRWAVTIREVVETLLLAVLIFLSVRASFQNFRVEGASMNPSLDNGEYLIVNKLAYAEIDLGIFDFLPFFDAGDNARHHLWGAPDRGDVIVFRAPTSPNRDFIKRIIGVPGDTVNIDEATGDVYVNGTRLDESYIQGNTNCNGNCQTVVPPAGSAESVEKCGATACYFVMGDNRNNSSDSRQGWLVPEGNIIGKALITYWHEGGPELDLAPNHSVSADEIPPGD